MIKPARADNFFWLLFHSPRKGRLRSRAGKWFPWAHESVFSTNHNSTLIFVELTHVGFAWGSWLQWPAVFKWKGQVFKLEGVIYYADLKSVGSMGFLGGKERIRIPINSKHSSLEALKHHVTEYTGSKSESEKGGLIRSSIETKLCRLETSAEWSKASAVNIDDNEDEMTFLRAVTILVAEEPSNSTLRLAWNSSDCFESFSPRNNVWIDRPLMPSSDATHYRKPGSDFDWLIV